MANFKLTEIKSLSEFLNLRHIRVEREQRRFSKNLLMTFLQTRHPAVTSYRIDAEGEAIGYVMLIHAENPTQWIIERLTINRDHQRKGYGYAIVDHLIDMVHDFENSEMVIARYEPDNEPARRLFDRLNFEQQEKMFRGRHIAILEFEFEDDANDAETDEDEDSEPDDTEDIDDYDEDDDTA
ncbi:MAG: GNAT family N-acetyltransferase [Chloroflexi bacterium]|nr:GNAT family N-acetyltransferase [Chloroflexota bacterium]